VAHEVKRGPVSGNAWLGWLLPGAGSAEAVIVWKSKGIAGGHGDGWKRSSHRQSALKKHSMKSGDRRSTSTIIDTVPALAWSTNPDGSFEFVNRRWRNYTVSRQRQVQEWDWKSTIHGEDIEHPSGSMECSFNFWGAERM